MNVKRNNTRGPEVIIETEQNALVLHADADLQRRSLAHAQFLAFSRNFGIKLTAVMHSARLSSLAYFHFAHVAVQNTYVAGKRERGGGEGSDSGSVDVTRLQVAAQ